MKDIWLSRALANSTLTVLKQELKSIWELGYVQRKHFFTERVGRGLCGGEKCRVGGQILGGLGRPRGPSSCRHGPRLCPVDTGPVPYNHPVVKQRARNQALSWSRGSSLSSVFSLQAVACRLSALFQESGRVHACTVDGRTGYFSH
jgi:hypothetical protein